MIIIGIGAASIACTTQAAQLAQAPAVLPPAVIQAITRAACDPTQLDAAVKAAVTANPNLAPDIVTVAVGQCPANAADIAATAATAAPTQAAAIVVAVIAALPPGQQENDAPGILVAVEQAVPESADQITTALTQLAFNPGNQGNGNFPNIGAPLRAPHTDVPSSPLR